MKLGTKVSMSHTEAMNLAYGVSYLKDDIYFKIQAEDTKSLDLLLYHHNDPNKNLRIPMDSGDQMDSVFMASFTQFPYSEYDYCFEADGRKFLEENVKVLRGRNEFGIRKEDAPLLGGFLSVSKEINEALIPPKIKRPYHEMILYELHVRGFTKHESSNVTHKGTYLGVIEKIPYLLELGVNTLVLMPITEFDERLRQQSLSSLGGVNYWGYGCDCYYYAPKSAYASDQLHPDVEVRQMVDELHKHGIEVLLQMNFTSECNPIMIADCLKYWNTFYQIDGFVLNIPDQYRSMIAADKDLREVKLLDQGWNMKEIMKFTGGITPKWLAEFHDGFKVAARRFLRGEEGSVGSFMDRTRYIPKYTTVINYVTNHDGFTMHDLYTYDVKHNEKNGEYNRDGNEYNFSWNCGFEGETKRKKINRLRTKMIKNAFLSLFLSQGTPMLLAGDEFGNTQNGNNNAYCQDNEISWIDWNLLEQNSELHDYVKNLIHFRMSHPILHPKQQLTGTDYIFCGVPDQSFHSTKVWRPDTSNYCRELGMYLCGKYIQVSRREHDNTFYFLYNMYWEKKTFDLPKLGDSLLWSIVCTTDDKVYHRNEQVEGGILLDQASIELPAKTICILVGVKRKNLLE